MTNQEFTCLNSTQQVIVPTIYKIVLEHGHVLSILDLVELMETIDIPLVLDTLSSCGFFEGVSHHDNLPVHAQKNIGLKNLREIRNLCAIFELTATLGLIDAYLETAAKLRDSLPETDEPSPGTEQSAQYLVNFIKATNGVHFADISKAFRIEIRRLQFFCIDGGHATLWTNAKSSWKGTIARLPATEDDIADAGKCLAVGLPTAAILHLSRVMEIGLKGLVDNFLPRLKSKIIKMGWEQILKEINNSIDTALHLSEEEKSMLRAFSIRINTIKDHWRNPTVHVEEGKRYSDSEAEDIYQHVRSFMETLVDSLP